MGVGLMRCHPPFRRSLRSRLTCQLRVTLDLDRLIVRMPEKQV
jgi:ferredoxin